MPPEQLVAERVARQAQAAVADLAVPAPLWSAVRVFNAMTTQWRYVSVGNTAMRHGLDYTALPVVLEALSVKADPCLLGYLQTMEAEALVVFSDVARGG